MRSLVATLSVAAVFLGVSRVTPTLHAQGSPVQTVKGGLVDEVKLFVAKLPETKVVVMKPFSATDADLTEGEKKDDTKKMQPIAGRTLGDEFVGQLKKLGPFSDVSLLAEGATPSADAIAIDGKFVE